MPDNWDFSQKPKRNPAGAPTTPLLTQVLGGLCVLLTLAWWAADYAKGTPWFAIGHAMEVPADEIWSGRWYGLLTSFFLHINILHLVFNMLWWLRLGTVLETTLSPLKYMAFLAGAALVGSCAELAVSGDTGVGASGVVYAMFGLLWAGRGAFPQWRMVATQENLKYFVVWGLFCVAATWLHLLNIGNAAHGAGFLFGLCIGWIFYAPRRRPLWAIPLALLAVLCPISLLWMPWSWQWNWWKGSQELDRKHYAAAVSAYQRSLRTGGTPGPLWNNIALAWAHIAEDETQRKNLRAVEDAQQKSDAAFEKSDAADAAQEKEAEKNDKAQPSADSSDDLLKRIHDKMQTPAPHK